MTTWKEAFNAFRYERNEAEKLKEKRDSIIWSLTIKKAPVTNSQRQIKRYRRSDVRSLEEIKISSDLSQPKNQNCVK